MECYGWRDAKSTADLLSNQVQNFIYSNQGTEGAGLSEYFQWSKSFTTDFSSPFWKNTEQVHFCFFKH